MPRTERSAEGRVKDSNEGTSARTRPFSFEEIMSRRRKKLAADPKGGIELRTLSEKFVDKGDTGGPDSEGCYKSTEVLNDAEKGSSKRKEGKAKGNRDLEANTKVKSSHSKSSRDEKMKNVKSGYHKSSTSDRLGADSERERGKKWPKDAVEKYKYEERDRESKREKAKHPSHIDEKSKLEFDGSYSKKHDYVKLRDTEYSERDDQRKGYSQPYSDERRSKRRRSRSPKYDRQRERSISVSPRPHKRTYHGREYGDSSFQSYRDKSRRKNLDTEKYRNGDDGYASGLHWKHGSGLGGYSPRKRKSEAAVKTPSPTIRSPERKSATWDQPPAGTNNDSSGTMLANLQLPATEMHELVLSVPVTPVTTVPQTVSPIDNASVVLNVSIDSVQLTQATRPMRRLYIENLPASASDKTIIDCLNDFLMLPGVNYIQRTKPCISCIINKEKSQAVAEFLTPEDARKALSFDGRSISGSVIKIRRPKDFVEAAQTVQVILDEHLPGTSKLSPFKTGALEKPVAVTKAISDVVNDTTHKIFVGGISRALSSDMLLEIVSAFGLLRAYRLEFNEELNGSIAFLEYADHSITLKACAGLNGMKLGGSVLTAVRAILDDHGEKETTDADVSYIIPKHAKPLLADPTEVLQLKNVFNRDEFSLLSEVDLEEALEDIRLECARFGTVKSVNIVRYDNNSEIVTEAIEQTLIDDSTKLETRVENPSIDSKQNGDLPSTDVKELQNVNNEEAVNHPEEKDSNNPFPIGVATVCEEPLNLGDVSGESPTESKYGGVKEEMNGVVCGLVSEMPKSEADTILSAGKSGSGAMENAEASLRDGEKVLVGSTNLNTTAADEGGIINYDGCDVSVFEPGCVLVEFSRAEATCMAAHCLHGRTFGEQIVMVGYVKRDLYLARFPR